MTGDNGGRLPQVMLWAVEHAASLGRPLSTTTLCETAVGRLKVDGVALTIDLPQGMSDTRCATNRLAEQLAALHSTVEEGPLVDARKEGTAVLAADLDTPDLQNRWPLFTPLAVEAGARAVFALPLRVGSIVLGGLSLHRVETRPLSPSSLIDALAFAQLALRMLLDEHADLPGPGGPPRLDALPLQSVQVHQATGMVSAQLGISMRDALATLRARAFAEQRTLNSLAAAVVAREVRFAPFKEPS
ncbi:ANTAR domain-containing protein [Amycolatopsis orientalis]|uniref:ANTAR domain-containing protein n=1 Tax=Amycolatopsis orientalis TaxID=31958 RepID=UPI000683E36F|nr:ANTAR domain-containing protein [Amycolatopsis orientalis]